MLTLIEETLISYQTPRARARARRARSARKLALPLFWLCWIAAGGLSSFRFCAWVSL